MHLLIWTVRVLGMVAVSLAAGGVGSLIVNSSALEWYNSLHKPALTPPARVFGYIWAALYLLMGIAAGMIWNVPVFLSRVRTSLAIFLLQLALNVGWVVLFFGFKLTGWALVDAVILWALVVVTAYLFYVQSRAAGIFLWPYLAWVTFAIYLNAGIVFLNR